MFRKTHYLRSAAMPALALALALAGASGETARAESRLTARYKISVAGIAIGTSNIDAIIGSSAYTTSASGRASGVLRILVSTEGSVSTRGAIVDGGLVPTSFTSHTRDEDERADVAMTLDGGNVKDLTAATSAPGDDVVPLAADHRRAIIDPLSALLVRPGRERHPVDPEACRRTLPIFDGRRRYDLALAFKRIQDVKTKGYAGPAVVCAVAFRAIAGHRTDSRLVKYLADGRDIELTLAPIAGTRLLAPFSLSIASMLGDMVIAPTAFETTMHE